MAEQDITAFLLLKRARLSFSHIAALEEERNQRITEPLFQHIPIPIPINIGKIQGGDWPSSVADLVTMEGRLGVMPGETVEQAEKELENWMAGLGEKDEWFQEHPVEVEWFGARWLRVQSIQIIRFRFIEGTI